MLADGWLTFDDYKAGGVDLSFRSSPRFGDLIGSLKADRRCVVADIDFCSTESREEAERDLLAEIPGLTLRWLFFENNPSACRANIMSRNRRCLQDEMGYLSKYSPSYDIPQCTSVLPIGENRNRCDAENRELRTENRS